MCLYRYRYTYICTCVFKGTKSYDYTFTVISNGKRNGNSTMQYILFLHSNIQTAKFYHFFFTKFLKSICSMMKYTFYPTFKHINHLISYITVSLNAGIC